MHLRAILNDIHTAIPSSKPAQTMDKSSEKTDSEDSSQSETKSGKPKPILKH